MVAMKRMRAFATFDDYLAAQTPRNQVVIRELRKFVRRVAPGLQETVGLPKLGLHHGDSDAVEGVGAGPGQ